MVAGRVEKRSQGREGLKVLLQEPEELWTAQASASRRPAGNWAGSWRERMESQTGLDGNTVLDHP